MSKVTLPSDLRDRMEAYRLVEPTPAPKILDLVAYVEAKGGKVTIEAGRRTPPELDYPDGRPLPSRATVDLRHPDGTMERFEDESFSVQLALCRALMDGLEATEPRQVELFAKVAD